MIRSLLRTTSFAMTCTAVMLLAAVTVVGSSRLVEAAVGLPFCSPYYYPLLSPCSQGRCNNPANDCLPDTQVINGEILAICICQPNIIFLPPP